MSLTIELAGEEVVLLPERGLFWVRQEMLLIADWHVGKAAALRASGIGVPDGDLEEELDRLGKMRADTGARQLVILGDFVHARAGMTPEIRERIADWVEASGIEVQLVSGNHDRSAGVSARAFSGVQMLGNEMVSSPFVLRHEPGASDDGYILSGHIHPAIRLGEGKRGGLRAPCFWFGEGCGVLPAFGGFTGSHRVVPVKGDRVYAAGGGVVVEVC